MCTALLNCFLLSDTKPPSSIYDPKKKPVEEQDVLGEAFGHVFSIIHSKTISALDLSSRVFTNRDGIDKFLKIISSGLMCVIVRFNDLALEVPAAINHAKDKFKAINDTFSGFSIVERIVEFTQWEQWETPNGTEFTFTFFRDSSYFKITNRLLLTVANLCDTADLIDVWSGKAQIASLAAHMGQITTSFLIKMGSMAEVASKIGRNPIFIKASQVSFKNYFVIGSCIANIMDICASLHKKGDLKEFWKNSEWKDSLTLVSDFGKIGMIIIGAFVSQVCYLMACFMFISNMSSLAKIALEDYNKNPPKDFE